MAITKFVAVISSPPNNIPAHTRPVKRDGTIKDKITVKKAVVLLPEKPMGLVLNKGVTRETQNL